MLGNKVSPASLYLASESSNHSEHVVCLSGADDSQYSQTSLFGSDAPSSMELFSQHSNSQGLSQNQPLETSCQNSTTTLMGTLEAKTKCDSTHIQSNPQISLSRTFYLKYLDSHRQPNHTRFASTHVQSEKNPSNLGAPSHSFESWKSKQLDRAQSKQFIKDVEKAVKDGMKKLKDEMCLEMAEVRTTISEKFLVDQQVKSLFAQLLQGQDSVRQGIKVLQEDLLHQKEAMGTLLTRIEAVESLLCSGFSKVHTIVEETATSICHCDGPRTVNDEGSTLTKSDKHQLKVQDITVISTSKKQVENQVGLRQDGYDQAAKQVDSKVGTQQDGCDQAVPYCGKSPEYSKARTQILTDTSPQKLGANRSKQIHPKASKYHQSDQSGVSTICDIDLTQQSPSLCSQVIAQLLVQDQTKRAIENSSVTEEKNVTCRREVSQCDPKKRKVYQEPPPQKHPVRQRTKRNTTRTTAQHQRSKRRSQRLQTRSLTTCNYFEGDDSSDCSVQSTKSRCTENVSQNSASLRAVPTTTLTTASPMNALDNSFYSQAAPSSTCDDSSKYKEVADSSDFEFESLDRKVPSKLHGELTSQLSKSDIPFAEKFQRSTEAAKRRVKIIAGMSNSTSAIHEISASIKQQQESRQYIYHTSIDSP